ncbi:hypothetical protein [Bradyrhizobium sp. MOS003]|jgi:hypothetical protein|uniref:hypothetical protein n=1 Tax=Bradyrhizobium sp. MOS003 TaxID=2133946 RepID=UPI000D124857|nr:hypothetical protein [Bradyrhizobium sp. MOS003]PSO16951.1 hypothetical protein C7G42_19305 [Bradyrhizobium sp. MOS003]
MFFTVIAGIGCTCLGMVVGGIVAFYIAKVREFTLRGLTSVCAIVGGAGVLKIFELLGVPAEPGVYWFYPIGLLIGAGGLASLHYNEPGQGSGLR